MLKKIDHEIIKGYLEDSSNLGGGHADGVYLPESGNEVAEALAECNDKKLPLTVSAGQTGTTGGCIPFGGWALSTQKLNKIISLDTKAKFAVVQPGVTLKQIEDAVSKGGLLYPPDPTEKSATIGGNVGTNAAGGRSYRFGSTRNWVRRLKIVQADSTTLNIKRGLFTADRKNEFALPHSTFKAPAYSMPKTKNSAGYFSAPGMDLLDLFIGAEGTLGIVSEIEIALAPALRETFDLVAFFPSEEQAVNFVSDSKAEKDPAINFYEFFDENALHLLKSSYPNLPAGARAAVYIEQEITAENEKSYLAGWGVRLEKHGASLDDCWLGADAGKKAELAKFRHAVPEHVNELFKQRHQVKLATDIAVPEDKFKEMFEFYYSSLAALPPSIFHLKFGHIGDNHLHVNLIADQAKDLLIAKELILKFVRRGIELGGTVSAEHGIGKIKREYLKEMYGDAGVSEMRRVKKIFDPGFILNPGNIFP